MIAESIGWNIPQNLLTIDHTSVLKNVPCIEETSFTSSDRSCTAGYCDDGKGRKLVMYFGPEPQSDQSW